jgi:hypothetical protein
MRRVGGGWVVGWGILVVFDGAVWGVLDRFR